MSDFLPDYTVHKHILKILRRNNKHLTIILLPSRLLQTFYCIFYFNEIDHLKKGQSITKKINMNYGKSNRFYRSCLQYKKYHKCI